eukprot:5999984-Amphidinium_carterae.3
MSLLLHSLESLPPVQVRIAVVVDGSPNAENEPRGQGGSPVALTTMELQKGVIASFSAVARRSGKSCS